MALRQATRVRSVVIGHCSLRSVARPAAGYPGIVTRGLVVLLVSAAACKQDPAPVVSPIDRAAAWMAAFPTEQLRFDAAIVLTAIGTRTDDLRIAAEHARVVADRDLDNPLRRAFDDAYRAGPASTSGWPVPAAGEPRVNVNRVVAEALHCRENGLRPETIAYATGPMRDGGGYHTTHAVWALVFARDRGCLPGFDAAVAPLLDELRAAQPAAPDRPALALDLFAERLLMLELAGAHDAAIDGWVARLAEAQSADGSFGELAAGENPYLRFHATMMATWALVEHER
jgi:hypothetical protein